MFPSDESFSSDLPVTSLNTLSSGLTYCFYITVNKTWDISNQ